VISHLEIKVDNRYKDGHIKQVGNKFRGNAKTMAIKTPEIKHAAGLHHSYIDEYYKYLALGLNPPIVVSRELGELIKESIDA